MPKRFNGAAALQRRRPGLHVLNFASQPRASMGPPLFSDGDACRILLVENDLKQLQWGRRSSATETNHIARMDAEIGKLQWGRRSSATETLETAMLLNSGIMRFNGAAALQRRRPSYYAHNNSRSLSFNGAAALQRRRRTIS